MTAHTTEQERAQVLAEKHGTTSYRNRADTKNPAFGFTLAQLAALIADVEQAARRAPAVPQGWKIVPEEDTPAMWTAGGRAIKACGGHERDAASLAYKAMLAAAPQPPEGKMISCQCGDEFPVDSYGAGFLDAKGRCFGCDAAADAASVQLPEPQAEIEVRSLATCLDLSIHEWRDTLPDGTYNVFTEQQVRQLLTDLTGGTNAN